MTHTNSSISNRLQCSLRAQTRAALAAIALFLPMQAVQADTVPTREPAHLDLSAEASQAALNDMVRAVVYTEANDTAAGPLAQRVNRQIAAAIEQIRNTPNIKVQNGNSYTMPVYGKNGRTIEGWRMHSELVLESKDAKAMSELLGKLQSNLAVANVQFMPSPEARKQAEDQAMVTAIQSFQARAQLASRTLGKTYKVHQMSINIGGQYPIMTMMKRGMAADAMGAEAAPMPMESGETRVSVTVSGQVDLLD